MAIFFDTLYAHREVKVYVNSVAPCPNLVLEDLGMLIRDRVMSIFDFETSFKIDWIKTELRKTNI